MQAWIRFYSILHPLLYSLTTYLFLSFYTCMRECVCAHLYVCTFLPLKSVWFLLPVSVRYRCKCSYSNCCHRRLAESSNYVQSLGVRIDQKFHLNFFSCVCVCLLFSLYLSCIIYLPLFISILMMRVYYVCGLMNLFLLHVRPE